MSPADGALSQLRAATDPERQGRRVLRAAVRQQRPAGAQADPARDRPGRARSPACGRCPSARPGCGSTSGARRGRRRPTAGGELDRAAAVRPRAAHARRRARLPRRLDERRGRRGRRGDRAPPTRTTRRRTSLCSPPTWRPRRELAAAATAGLDAARRRAGALPRDLAGDLPAPRRATATTRCFLLQVDCSPYRAAAHEAALAGDGDPLVEQAATPDDRRAAAAAAARGDLRARPGPGGPAGRERRPSCATTSCAAIADACWRAISLPAAAAPSRPARTRR